MDIERAPPLKPFLPSDLARPDQALTRSAAARFIAFSKNLSEEAALDIARRAWPRDMVTEFMITRAPVAPTSTTTASALASKAVGSFIASLAPAHAGARLIGAGLNVPLLGANYSISLPGVTTYPIAPFVAENDPIPVAAATLNAAVLGPVSRLAVITGATSSLADVAVESVEATLGGLMRESAARALDTGLFSATPGSTSRPAGLLYNVTPITAASGGGQAALLTDLRKLVGAIADAGGGESVWLFAHPSTAVALTLLAAPTLYLPVIPTKVLPSGTVIAIEVGAFASGFTSEPEISVGRESTLHFDTTPLPIGVSGSPTAPTSSMWQQDLVALRLILRCAWTVRGTGMVQVVNSVTW